jgi:bifunctional DNA primase/polymerase-like protein
VSGVDFTSEALRYAELLGWKVLLLAPGCKLPYISKQRGGNGVHDATSDPDQIVKWGKLCPNGNIGIASGPASGIVVVDVDPRNGGGASLASLAAKGRVLPSAPRQRTGNGGWHYLLRADPSIGGSKGRLGAHRSQVHRRLHRRRPIMDPWIEEWTRRDVSLGNHALRGCAPTNAGLDDDAPVRSTSAEAVLDPRCSRRRHRASRAVRCTRPGR